MKSIQKHKEFIEENGGVFNVHDLGRHLGWNNGDGLDKKALSFNGAVNYDRSSKTLSLEQLRVILPDYLGGRRALAGERRVLVEGFCTAAGFTSLKTAENEPLPKTVKQPKRKIQAKKEETPENASSWKQHLFLSVAILAVFWQASHFSHLEAMDSPFTGNLKLVIAWGIALVFESLALLLTVFSDKESKATWYWLIGFAVVAVFMNLSFYGVISAAVFRKIILSVALPFSIVASTHLFISSK